MSHRPDHGTRTVTIHPPRQRRQRTDVYAGVASGLQRTHANDYDWQTAARCRGWGSPKSDPWFASTYERRASTEIQPGLQQVAIAHCMVCPVARPCLIDALTRRPQGVAAITRSDGAVPDFVMVESESADGIWGGTLPADRKGKTEADVDDLLRMARERAVAAGLAPRWLLREDA